MLDLAVYPNYRNLYVYALASIEKDLRSPVKQFYIGRGSTFANGKPWYEVFGANLAAARRDAVQLCPDAFIPSLTTAVELWAEDKLRNWCILKAGDDREAQIAINAAIAERLDIIYTNGDPILTAFALLKYPAIVEHFAINAGINASFCEIFETRITETAQRHYNDAIVWFAEPFAPSLESMFLPSPKNKK